MTLRAPATTLWPPAPPAEHPDALRRRELAPAVDSGQSTIQNPKSKMRSVRRAILLVEVLMVMVIVVVLVGLLFKLVIDAMYLQRIAAQHAARVATMDSLTRRLQRDALATTRYDQHLNTLTLRTLAAAGGSSVSYTIEPEFVRRVQADGDDREWRAERLRFDWHIEHGARGDVLILAFTELPPPRATILPNRSYPAAFGLPRAQPPLRAPAEAQP